MGTNGGKNAAIKSTGEIIDEFITLCIKYTHTHNQAILDKINDILSYLEEEGNNTKYLLVLSLMGVNSICWVAQDKIMDSNENKDMKLIWAALAQISNKTRNKVIATINSDTSDIKEKTY